MKMILMVLLVSSVSAFAQSGAAVSGADPEAAGNTSMSGANVDKSDSKMREASKNNNTGGSVKSQERRQDIYKKKSGWRNKKNKDRSSR